MECGGKAKRRHRFVFRAERAIVLIFIFRVGSASKKSAVAASLCRRTPNYALIDGPAFAYPSFFLNASNSFQSQGTSRSSLSSYPRK